MASTPAAALPQAAGAPVPAPSVVARGKKRTRELDFFSAAFNPSLALSTPDLQPPLPLPPCESWQECEQIVSQTIQQGREQQRLFETWVDTTAAAPRAAPASAPASAASSAATSIASSASTAASSLKPSMVISSHDPSPLATPSPAPVPHLPTISTTNDSSQSQSSASTPVTRGSRMTPEQIQANLAKATAKATQNRDKKEKQSHFLDRFTTTFPTPPPISSLRTESKSQHGPMQLLINFYNARARVFVVTRRSHSIRSVLSGFLQAFDKHFNIILLDVNETTKEWVWKKKPKQGAASNSSLTPATSMSSSDSKSSLAEGSSSSDSSRSGRDPEFVREQVLQQRHVHQLFIRGDSVVTISQHQPAISCD